MLHISIFMIYKLEKLTIRDTFKQWRDKINIMADKMNSALYADETGTMTIGPDECNTVKFVVKVPTDFTSEVHFTGLVDNTGSYISSASAETKADTVNAGLQLIATEGYVPWISGRTANGRITQYTSNDDDNLYFSFIGDDGNIKDLFHWDNENNRIDGTITNSINSDYAEKVKSVVSNANKNYNVTFCSTENGYASQFEDNDITYNPYTNTLSVSYINGHLNGTADTAELARKAEKLTEKRTISLSNHVSGSTRFDGSEDVDIIVTIPNTGVTSGNYGESASKSLSFGETFTVPYYTVNERGQLTQSKNISLSLPNSTTDILMNQSHSITDNTFPILAVTTANAAANLGAAEGLFNKDIKVNPKTGTIYAKNAEISDTLTAKNISATTINATTVKMGDNILAIDDNVVHKNGNEEISGQKTFKGNTVWTDKSDSTHNVGFTVNDSSKNGGVYDWTNSKWVFWASPSGTNTFNGSANTLTTGRQLKVLLSNTSTNATFDGSANVTNIPVTGTLSVANGGTGVTSISEIKAGKDASGNTITTTYATKTEVNAKAPLNSPALTGEPTSPTVTNIEDNSDKIATTKFVSNYVTTKISNAIGSVDAMSYMGTVTSASELPANHTKGWTYKVATAGTYAGKVCEVGDMIICNTSGNSANNAHWDVIQNNIDGAVTCTTTSVNAHIAIFNGTTGKIIKDSGFTIGTSVPANATFTDTTYALGTLAQLKTGTDTTGKVWGANVLSSYLKTPATTNALGSVQISSANGLSISSTGVLSMSQAATNAFGTVKAGNNISVSNGVISVATAATNALGLVKVGSNITVSSGTISITKANVIAALGYTPPTSDTNTWTALKGATSSANGTVGYINATPPSNGYNTKYFRADGTWQVPPDTVYTHPTTAGNKHVPAGGESGQTLIWSAAGTAKWGRKVTIASSTASGGSNGDIWYQYI